MCVAYADLYTLYMESWSNSLWFLLVAIQIRDRSCMVDLLFWTMGSQSWALAFKVQYKIVTTILLVCKPTVRDWLWTDELSSWVTHELIVDCERMSFRPDLTNNPEWLWKDEISSRA